MSTKNDEFVKLILNWFESNKRNFSWRTMELTPFQLLVAELMLQKTNSKQVEKIFPSFIEKYHDAKSISKIKEEKLVKELQPLGLFNRRARDLKKTAAYILENDNKIPENKKDLKKLPGVGDYIANALLCFAFDKPESMIDANVGRVIKRVFNFPVKKAPSRDKQLAEMMSELIPKNNFKDFNHAILDFAALVCKPKNPNCEDCPLNHICNYII